MQIYKITNKINGKVYIGLTTVGIKKRICSYKSNVKAKRTKGQWILSAMIKYGFENFQFDILEVVQNKNELRQREIYYIALFKSMDPDIGYNRDPGGYSASQEALLKRSEKLKDKPLSEEHKKKISEGLAGHSVSEESKKKMSRARLGKSPANKGRKKYIINGKIRYLEA